MATYYDPRQDSTIFSVYSQAYRTQQQEKEQKEAEEAQKTSDVMGYGKLGVQLLEGMRADRMREAQLLLSQRDPDSVTGMKYDLNEEGPTGGWWSKIKHRYRKAEDRVKLSERTPEAKIKIAETEQLSQLSDPDFRYGEFDPVKYQKDLDKKAKEFQEITKGGMKIERERYYSSPELKAKEAKRKAMKDIAEDARLNKIESDVYSQYKKRFESMPMDQAQLELGIVEPIKPQSPGMASVARTDEFEFSGRTPKYQPTQGFNISAEERDALVAGKLQDYDFESPGVSESQLAGRISGSRQRLTPTTDPFVDTALGARDEVGRAAVRLGNLETQEIDLLEQAQGDLASYQFKGGSRVSDVEGFTDPNEGLVPDTISPRVAYDSSYADEFMNKAVATDKIDSDTSDLVPPFRRTDPSIYGREGYETQQILKGNYAVDTPQADLPESVRGRMGKELVDKVILEDAMDLPEYDSFGELIKARDAAEKGTGLYKGLQGQINELFKRGGGTYEGASKAFGTVDLGSDLRQAGEATEGLASAIEAVDVGEDVASATAETGGKGVPGLGEVLAAKDLYSAWGGEGTQTDKVGATVETAGDLASTYAISSGNPYAMAAGGIYKAGKFAWDLLT